ncbi:hypothetical protein GCM10023232_26930 [Sphingosinicella ginsenosidimutans]|uniref:DUF669 domain-containing protein n=1 Tax=Allosphingosinicella ginsenosidimutans TaxID=1176539 RepID=A0A5C6TTU5_9SPHN|nr:DUF669 domain-containing protein [Sphingosinicella ginsenosidimutans]TXC63696.1 DUF669 domain-containing protein [Sphingosinicella ginsenosidimutans]
MANLGGTFDATQVEPNAPFEVIPPGDYEVQITASSMESNKAGTGSYLKLELEIVDGPQAGRKLFDRLNLDNPNAQAVEIAQRTLSAICHAVGVLSVADSEELHLRPMIAKIKVVPRNDRPGEHSNEIGGYKPIGGSAVVPAQQTKTAPKPAASTGSAPWKRNAA